MNVSARRSALMILALLPAAAMAQSAPPGGQSEQEAKEMYRDYCASCHGLSGKGDGPAAKELRVRPADLTMLAMRNRGQFPEMAVMGAIKAGPAIPAHGSATMPVWGPIFLETTGAATESEVQLKIFNLMEYLRTLQAKSK